jgi:hypothetical protein
MSRKTEVTTGQWLTPKSPHSVGTCLAEAAHEIAGRPVAIVVRYPITETTLVIAVSAGADRRVLGMRISPESAVGRTCIGGVDTEGRGAKELLGCERRDHRQREKEGVAIPIRDGDTSVGALVVFAPPELVDDATTIPLTTLASEAGPPLRAAVETPAHEVSSLIDPVTKQPNLQALEQSMSKRPSLRIINGGSENLVRQKEIGFGVGNSWGTYYLIRPARTSKPPSYHSSGAYLTRKRPRNLRTHCCD